MKWKRNLLPILTFLAASCGTFAQQPAERRDEHGILIEAEAFDRKVSEVAGFAKPSVERHGSGRSVLSRFFPKGHVVYRFSLPEAGAYTGWLRYGSKTHVRLGVALDPSQARPPAFDLHTIEPTGGYVGESVWRWTQIFSADLAAGDHTLALGSGPFRPDCIYVTRSADAVTDAVIRLGPPELDAKTRALIEKPLSRVRPEWLDGAEAYRLPDWYDQHRVQAHTRLSARYMDNPIFLSAAEAFREMGCRVFTRHIKSGKEGAWWPSAVGAVLPEARDRNWAKDIIDNAHNAGGRIIVYHRHMEDAHMAEQHPDWVCRDHAGRPRSSSRGDYMCFNSPYPDYFLQRALELVDLGADGFYFDEAHMPKTGCWCASCRKRFKEETGLDHPLRPDPDDPVWHKLIDFNNATIERTFLKWRQALHARNPDLVMLVGSNTWPMMVERHLTSRLFRIADSVKTEFALPARMPAHATLSLCPSMQPLERDAKIALGYVLARDAAGGRPAHIWTHNLLSETGALHATAGMLTHGCIANLDVAEGTLPNAMFNKAFALGEKVSPYLAGTAPVRWAALHYSERARDRYAADPAGAWEKVLYPFYGAFLVLLRARLPVGIVTDSQLEDGLLDGYDVLFLPAPDALTDPMCAVAATFRENGGRVVEQGPAWKWHDPGGGHEAAKQKFANALADAANPAPVQVFGGPETMHATAFSRDKGGTLTVSLANDFAWVHTGRIKDDSRAELVEIEGQKVPAPCADVRIVLRRQPLPAHAIEVITGETLDVNPCDNGVEIRVPEFAHMALVVLKSPSVP